MTVPAVFKLFINANRTIGIVSLDALEDFEFSHETPKLLAIQDDSRNPSQEVPHLVAASFSSPFSRKPSKSTA